MTIQSLDSIFLNNLTRVYKRAATKPVARTVKTMLTVMPWAPREER